MAEPTIEAQKSIDAPETVQPYQATELAPRREIWAWAMFDFANSSYTTIVTTTIFNQYFVKDICRGMQITDATWHLTTSLAISNLLVVLTAPLIGALADGLGRKKLLMVASTLICVLSTAALAFLQPGMVIPAMVFFILSGFGFGTSEYLIAAFLPEIAPKERMGKVSSLGWTLGYVGGLVVLAACLAFVQWQQKLGAPATTYVPVILVFVAVIFTLAALPTFVWLKERARPQSFGGDNLLRAAAGVAISRLSTTLKQARGYRDLFVFLLALFCFSCGSTTVVAMAAVYAAEVMKFSTADTIGLVMVVNIAAAVGAFGLGAVQDKIGSVPTLIISLILWVVAVTLAYLAPDRTLFWVSAGLMGAAMGASGSASRALVGLLSPPGQAAEFFGLWGLTVKLSAVLGPLTYSAITSLTGGNYRQALLSTIAFFILGLIVTSCVNQKRGMQAVTAAGEQK